MSPHPCLCKGEIKQLMGIGQVVQAALAASNKLGQNDVIFNMKLLIIPIFMGNKLLVKFCCSANRVPRRLYSVGVKGTLWYNINMVLYKYGTI